MIAPSVAPDLALPGWLANLLDGLGLATVSVVAEHAFVDDVRRLAQEDAMRVREVKELKVPWSGLTEVPDGSP